MKTKEIIEIHNEFQFLLKSFNKSEDLIERYCRNIIEHNLKKYESISLEMSANYLAQKIYLIFNEKDSLNYPIYNDFKVKFINHNKAEIFYKGLKVKEVKG